MNIVKRFFHSIWLRKLHFEITYFSYDIISVQRLSSWKYQFSYNHWSQAKLSLVCTWMGDCSSVVWVLLLTLKVGHIWLAVLYWLLASPTLLAQGVSAHLTGHILEALLPQGNWRSEQNSNVHRHKALVLSSKKRRLPRISGTHLRKCSIRV